MEIHSKEQDVFKDKWFSMCHTFCQESAAAAVETEKGKYTSLLCQSHCALQCFIRLTCSELLMRPVVCVPCSYFLSHNNPDQVSY